MRPLVVHRDGIILEVQDVQATEKIKQHVIVTRLVDVRFELLLHKDGATTKIHVQKTGMVEEAPGQYEDLLFPARLLLKGLFQGGSSFAVIEQVSDTDVAGDVEKPERLDIVNFVVFGDADGGQQQDQSDHFDCPAPPSCSPRFQFRRLSVRSPPNFRP